MIEQLPHDAPRITKVAKVRRILSRAGFIAMVGLLLLLNGCAEKPPLKVAVAPWIGYETLYIADNLGWLPTDVVLHESRSLGDAVRALERGEVDAAALTLDEALLARSHGIPLTVVMVFNVSAGADALLARPEFNSLQELRGRRIGYEASALGPLVLAKALASADMTTDDVIPVPVAPDQQLAAWQQGQLDAVVSYGPAVGLLEEQGAVWLFDSREMPDTILDVLAVHRDHVDHPALRSLIEAHFRGLRHIQRSREDALNRIAVRQQVPLAAAERALNGISLPDLARNRSMLAAAGPVMTAARELSRLMVSHDILRSPDTLAELVDDGAVRLIPGPN